MMTLHGMTLHGIRNHRIMVIARTTRMATPASVYTKPPYGISNRENSRVYNTNMNQ